MKTALRIVACCYRLSPDEMVRRVQALLGEAWRAEHAFVVSAHIPAPRDRADGWTELPSDNRDFDFSAYVAGAQALLARTDDTGPVLFVNDTLFTDHAAVANFKAAVRQHGLMAELGVPAMAGKTDRYTTICLRSPWSGLDLYVPTYCFLLNRAALDVLLDLRRMAEDDGVTHEHDVDADGWGRGLQAPFREFLRASLVYRASPYLWYRLRSGAFSAEQLRAKARSIYFEHRLSGAIGASGCLLPTNAGPRWGSYLSAHERLFRLRRRVGL